MTGQSKTPLLDTVDIPADIRRLKTDQLRQLADELRQETISAVSVTGGHLGAGLGVVELTVALHYVFNTPKDRLIWDVGHQAYPHKIVTGRRSRIRTLRQEGGLSGFTRRSESEYDPFGAAHSSTSISAGLGMAVARDLAGGNNHVVAVIGDGAMSAGMAYEAMNNAGALAQPADRGAERQRHVDRPAGRRHVGPSVAPAVGPALRHPAQSRPHLRRGAAQAARARGQARRGIRARLRGRRHPVRRAGLLLCRPGRRAQSRPSAAGAEERARQPARQADPGPCRDQEGQGLSAGRGERRQVPWRREVRRHHRQAVQAGRQCAGLSGRVRQGADRRGRGRQEDRRHHRRDAVGHQPRQVRRALSRALLRCRHRRAARRHLRRGPCLRGLQAVRGDLLDLPAARLRPGRARRRHPEAAGALRHRPRRAWSAPTAPPMPAPTTSPISPACRASSSWRRPTSSN